MILGAYSFDLGLVQPVVAKFARVCTFDLSGTAWSDPFPLQKSTVSSKSASSAPAQKSRPTCEDRVEEIHRLITNAPIDGPYIFVGFSVGALWERIYAARYPANITGMVIVDHAFQGGSNGTTAHAANAKSFPGDYSPPVLVSKTPLTIGFEDSLNFSKLPQQDQELHTWALSQHPILVDYEMVADCFSQIEVLTRGHAYPLGNMRLVVISTQNEAPGYSQLQAKLLALSHNSEHIIAWNSTHMVPIDEPDVIVDAIHELVESGRRPMVNSRIP
jgi:pimeloyl-ACP methyl ester carboxylesterase